MWTAFASTAVTSSMFLTALGPNLLALGIVRKTTGIDVTWSQWVIGFLPVGLLLIAPLPLLVYLIYPRKFETSTEVSAWAKEELARMGRPSAHEAIIGLLIIAAFSLWLFAAESINPTTVIFAVIALLIVTRILDWDDVIGNRAAWDTLIYFATLLSLAEGLEKLGIVAWAAEGVPDDRRLRTNRGDHRSGVVLLPVHYMFASLTAHTIAVLPALLAAGTALPGMPVKVLSLLLVYSIGLMGVITPYATGPAPVYFGSGFIPRKDFWVLGFVFGLIYLTSYWASASPTCSRERTDGRAT